MIGAPGYVKVHRSFLDWEWYGDDATVRVFLHLLLTSNWEEKRWRGEVIKPGQQITSMEAIALKLELSRATVRRCIEKLKSTGELTIQTNNHWTAITLVNWAKYQGDDQPTSQPNANQRPTSEQTSGRQVSQPAATTKEGKKLRREEVKNSSELPLTGIVQEGQRQEFGDPRINELMSFLKAANGNMLDGSIKKNRNACHTLINKALAAKPDGDPVAGIKALITRGKAVPFHGPKITSFMYLVEHVSELKNHIQNPNGNGKQQSPEDKREAARRALAEQQSR